MMDLKERASELSWASAVKRSGQSDETAVRLAALRLLLWHALQPSVFLIAWWVCDTDNDFGNFAEILAIREAAYLGVALVLAWVQPCYLLVDVSASWAEGQRMAVLMYVLLPEKLLFGWFAALLGWSSAFFTLLLGGGAMIAAEMGGWIMLFDTMSIVTGHGGLSSSDGADFRALCTPLQVGFVLTAMAAVAGIVPACNPAAPLPMRLVPWVSASLAASAFTALHL